MGVRGHCPLWIVYSYDTSFELDTLFIVQFGPVPDLPEGQGPVWTAYPYDTPQELEVFLQEKYFIHAVEIQGAPDKDEWVTKFEILYKLTNTGHWSKYADSDGETQVYKPDTV